MKLKEGQTVVYQGEKYEFIEYSSASPTGVEQRVILRRKGIEISHPAGYHEHHEVLERELED
jgi:hypothetical protein